MLKGSLLDAQLDGVDVGVGLDDAESRLSNIPTTCDDLLDPPTSGMRLDDSDSVFVAYLELALLKGAFLCKSCWIYGDVPVPILGLWTILPEVFWEVGTATSVE